jgi:hypothetical protein
MRTKYTILPVITGTILAVLIGGCASSERQTTTRTTLNENVPMVDNCESAPPPAGVVEPASTTQTTTSTVTQTQEHHESLFGSIFHGIGHILAFPFKVIATVIETIL